jgi:hypothetical protein
MSLGRALTALAVSTFLFAGTSLFPEIARSDNGGLVSLINQYRASNGLGTLAEDQKLTNAACWLGGDMAAHQNMSHIDSLGRDMAARLTAFGVSGGSRGENVAKIYNSGSGQPVLDIWKNSSGHNAIMLSPNYTRIGVGIAKSGSYYYWAADFASGTAVSLTSACGAAPSPKPAAPPKPPSYATPDAGPTPPATVQATQPSASLSAEQKSSVSGAATIAGRTYNFPSINHPLVGGMSWGIGLIVLASLVILLSILLARHPQVRLRN